MNKKMTKVCTHHRVETYSVYGGSEETSRASPKSAIFMTSLLTNKFSEEKFAKNTFVNITVLSWAILKYQIV